MRQFIQKLILKYLKERVAPGLVAGLALGAIATPAFSEAQNWPVKPITVLVPSPPGGIIDSSARVLTDTLGRNLRQSFVIENKSGGSGNVAYAQVARSAPDGYTLLASLSGFHVGNPSLIAKLPWSQKDFVPIGMIGSAPNVIVVNPSLPIKTLAELIAYLKAHPGQVSYASQGVGSVSHIGTEILKQMTGTHILHIPYRGSAQALQDVIAGQVQILITTPPSIIGHIQTGKLRALAVASKNRYPGLPDVPTAAEAGLKGYEVETWVGLFAPSATPAAVLKQLSAQTEQALAEPEVKARAAAAGFEAKWEPPAVLSQRVLTETKYWAKIIGDLGIKSE